MTDTLFVLVATYGGAALFVVTFFSCLAVPVPSSLMMITGGAFAATGDLLLGGMVLSAYAGAVIGDQVGYLVGRLGAIPLERWAGARRNRTVLLHRARLAISEWGGPGVFFSRWLVSPLGPYVNFASGAGKMEWARFTLWGAVGEAVWVSVYVGLGYAFANNLELVVDIVTDFSGLVVGAVLTAGIGLVLVAIHRRQERRRGRARQENV
jgi:membrane protein DedA with SNARE-associated domain